MNPNAYLPPPIRLKNSHAEATSVCGNCPKISSQKYKCCTYWPLLPNYLVGAVLSQEDTGDNSTPKIVSAGIENCTQLIQKLKFALPIGLCPPPAYQAEFHINKNLFGKLDDLLCPFYDLAAKKCQIWKYRSQECYTYFCSKTPQHHKKQTWQTLGQELFDHQNKYSQEIMIAKGYTYSEVLTNLDIATPISATKLNNQALQRITTSTEDKLLWAHHHKSKVAFYKDCWRIYKEFTSLDRPVFDKQ